MDLRTALDAIVTFVSWGRSTFFDKPAADHLGAQTAIWHSLGYTSLVVVYGLIAYNLSFCTRALLLKGCWGLLYPRGDILVEHLAGSR